LTCLLVSCTNGNENLTDVTADLITDDDLGPSDCSVSGYAVVS